MADERPLDLTTRILVEIRQDLRELRSEVGAVKADLRAEFRSELRSEIGSVRGELGVLQSELGSLRAELKGEIAELAAVQRGQAITLGQILRAVEHGNEVRDERVADHERRLERLETHLGLPPGVKLG